MEKPLTLQQMRDAGFTEARCYTALLERIQGSINEWRLLAHDAHKRGDATAAWEAGAQIKELERKRDSMRPPAPCNNVLGDSLAKANNTNALD